MDKKTVDISKEMRKAERKARRDAWIKEKKDWINDNKQVLIVGVPAVCAVAGKFIKGMTRHHNIKMEQRDRDLRWYDASLGSYYRLRKKPDNRDRLEVSRRKAMGEDLGSILEDLGLLR